MNPEFLVLLIALPLLVLTHIYLFKFTRKKAMMFSNLDTLKRVTGKNLMRRYIWILLMRLTVFILLIFALSQPEIWYLGEAQRSDYVIAIDTSASMTADDLTPNRMEASKTAALEYIDYLNTSAMIGVIGFSGTVTVEQIVTPDAVAAKRAIERLEIQTVSGTDISSALITGTNLLLSSTRGRVILLFTDGSATVGAFEQDPLERGVKYAKDNKVVVHAIGMGRLNAAVTGYLPRLYNITAAYNQENLEYIADQTGGLFYQARNDEQLDALYEQLNDTESRIQVTELWFSFLLLALLLLFIEWGLTNTRFRIIP